MAKSLPLFCSIACISAAILVSMASGYEHSSGVSVCFYPEVVPVAPQAEWTIMVFMNGDNNLEEDALTDFREMGRVGSSDKVNVIVQFDRHGRYPIRNETKPKWTQTLRFRVTKSMEPIPANALADIGESNMGDGGTLRDFVTWTMRSFPAKHFMLLIWDHGQGWRGLIPESSAVRALIRASTVRAGGLRPRSQPGAHRLPSDNTMESSLVMGSPFRSPSGSPYRSASQDETDADELYNREIQDALGSVLQGRKLDIIGFDACLMAMVETAYAMRGVASILVGSEDLEPGTGWQYDDWLGALVSNPSIDGVILAKILVDSYRNRYSTDTKFLELDPTTTQSAIDLTRIDAVADNLSTFANRLTQSLDDEFDNIKAARNDCSNFAPNPYGEDPPRDYFFHIDFVRFCDRIVARTGDVDLKARARTARSSVLHSVLWNYAGLERQGSFGSNGLAIYFPSTAMEYRNDQFAEGGYDKANTMFRVEFVQKHTWSNFLHSFLAHTR